MQALLPRITTIISTYKENMKTLHQYELESMKIWETSDITNLAKTSFAKIAPLWPLKNLIAVNPLQGFENLPIEDALNIGAAHFQQADFPKEMEAINIETIKWLQAYFDEGQATISMPHRGDGLYKAWHRLARYDKNLYGKNKHLKEWLYALPEKPEQAIAACLSHLKISEEEHEQFLTLMLTTLPGWASYIKYRTEWAGLEANHPHPVTQVDYIAVRLIITNLLWSQAKKLLDWHKQALEKKPLFSLEKIEEAETAYRLSLLQKISSEHFQKPRIPEAQFVFCIDVRSEPFRSVLESTGDYQTFGFAGFFGIPVEISNTTTKNSYASCPVLLSPKYQVKESPKTQRDCSQDEKGYKRLIILKQLYQSVKYTFTTPFGLVEALGLFSGLWMGLRSFFPSLASRLKFLAINIVRAHQELVPLLDSIPLAEQCNYAENTLKMIGLTNQFAPLVVFCGHGSATQNNAYSSALDCGACGGRHGASNARILAAIINQKEVRLELARRGIHIPETTKFIPAEHNTTTDELVLLGFDHSIQIDKLKEDLLKARRLNNLNRLEKRGGSQKISKIISDINLRSIDWAETRPEWGLARNTSFIVAPRDLTYSLDLDGRCFLHSYDYRQDPDETFLTTILTAPMIVAQWINAQYLFSTIDNVAYGGGSKITQNITGKIGIMQGNASDLMTGLPLQSLYSSDTELYHEPQRLMTVVFAPRYKLDKIIHGQLILKKLFGNGWVQMACIEPDNNEIYLLNRDFSWKKMH